MLLSGVTTAILNTINDGCYRETSMVTIGEMNRLTVCDQRRLGTYLDAGELGEVLLPQQDGPADCKVGDELEVFVYVDSDGTLVAAATRPLALLGQVALLRVVAVEPVGAFLDWGLRKELLLPFGEQLAPVKPGQQCLVYLYRDPHSGRIAASQKLDRFLDNYPPAYKRHQAVELVIAEHTDIGYKAVVNHAHWGVLYDDEVFQPLHYGQQIRGYIKKVRPDGKIDLYLHQPGYGKVEGVAAEILERLRESDGFLPLNDKSPPQAIYAAFGVSKKAFKLGISALYRERLIRIGDDGLHLLERG